jgi:ASC-1-like (ASCH) protein
METSPFAIRLEVLKMAKELSESKFCAMRDQVQCNWDNTRDIEGKAPTELIFPEFPSEEEILRKAKELYKFVQEKS